MSSTGYPRFDDPNGGKPPPVIPGDTIAGKYRVERVVGAGAMGFVLRARHIELDHPVAIKFLNPELATDALGAERFRREARAAARITSSHVARVLDVGVLDEHGIPYIVMEFLEGRDLERELHSRGSLPVREVVGYVLEACEAIAEAHNHGIVHRDLKPANLFLAKRPSGTRMIKVLDFGISKMSGAKSTQPSITDTASFIGSPAYMSPEQLESPRDVDPRSDVWSLGVIMHELVTGELPFTAETVPQLVRAIVSGARKPIGNRGSLGELERIVVRCLREDPGKRYQSVPDLCLALQRIAHSDTLGSAIPPGFVGRTRLSDHDVTPGPTAKGNGVWVRKRKSSWQRHRVPLAGAALALLVLAGGWGLRSSLRTEQLEGGLETAVAPLSTHGPGATPEPLAPALGASGAPALEDRNTEGGAGAAFGRADAPDASAPSAPPQ